jgi:hypothetical protein
MRRLVTGRSCRLSSRRSLALRPRLSAGLPCFRPDPVTANLAADERTLRAVADGTQCDESTVWCFAASLVVGGRRDIAGSPVDQCRAALPGVPREDRSRRSEEGVRDHAFDARGSENSPSSSSAGSGRPR